MATPPMTRAEPLIQASLLGEAIDRGPVAVFVADENMRYIAVNQFAADLLGYTREEVLELTVTDVARTSGSPDEYEEMIANRGRVGTTVLTRKDGTTFAFRYRAHETRISGMLLYVSVGVADGD